MKSCSKVKKFCLVVAASVSAPLECNNWRPTCISAAECSAQLAVCTLYCKLQPMCSLTGEHSSSSRYVWDSRVVARPLHPGIQIDGLKLPPSPLHVYTCLHISTCHVSSLSGSLLLIAQPAPAGVKSVSWRAWQQWAGVRAPHHSRANIHCNKKYSLMACTHHHSHRHWIHSARRALKISPTTRS